MTQPAPDSLDATSQDGLPFPRRTIAIIAISAGSSLLMMDSTIATAALPSIAQHLNVPGASAIAIVTVYQLLLAMTIIPFSALGDRIGHRHLYQSGQLVFTLGASLCLFAHSFTALLIIRSVQALGVAAAMSVSFGIVRAIYPQRALGRGLGLNTLANATGMMLGPSVGGLIMAFASWQWVFAAGVPLAILSLLLGRSLPDPVARPGKFDLAGAGLCAATFAFLILGFQSFGKSPPALSTLMVVAGAGLAYILFKHAAGQSRPVLPIDLLAHPTFAFSLLAGYLAIVASITNLLALPFRLHHDFGFGPGEIGGMVAFYPVASIMIAPAAGMLSDRISPKHLSLAGLAVAAPALLLTAFLPARPDFFDIAWRAWLCGAGFALFLAPNARLIVSCAPRDRAAAAGGLVTTNRMVAQASAAALVGGLLAIGYGAGPLPSLLGVALLGTSALCILVRPSPQSAIPSAPAEQS